MSIISNTTVISNFAAIGQLDRLRELFEEVFISTHVYEEIQAGLEEGYEWYQPVEALMASTLATGWLKLTSLSDEEELRLFRQMPRRLHQGEASSISIAHNRGWTFLTDDRAARAEAYKWGIDVSGTIGCLVLLVERHHCALEQANQCLGQMIALGYRSPIDDLGSIARIAS